jgi:hypothetical protein
MGSFSLNVVVWMSVPFGRLRPVGAFGATKDQPVVRPFLHNPKFSALVVGGLEK